MTGIEVIVIVIVIVMVIVMVNCNTVWSGREGRIRVKGEEKIIEISTMC